MKDERILGIDYGSKRVGLAISDENKKLALPLSVIENNQNLLKEIVSIANGKGVKRIVLGESRDYKGKPNEIFGKVEEFKKELEEKGFMVHLEPEFMTTVQAERLQGKHDKIHASAAALILQSFLERTPAA